MDLDELLKAAEQGEEQLLWEGTFAQYLRMVVDNPALARLSHTRVHDMIFSYGVAQGLYDQPAYGLFSKELFGLDEPLGRLVQYLASAAQRSQARHRILLLLGPPSSGKSSIVNLIKQGLEAYTRKDEGALYAIKGCPMQEEPLHLIPPHLRHDLEKQFGLYVEGDLCPRCRYVLRREYDGKVSEMPVRRIAVSEMESVGIGTFVASDPGAQNAALLVGSVDTTKLEGDRLEVAGRAYRLDGELNVANRGLMEFAEVFKCESGLLALLLGLAQEQVIKMGRFGSVYADETVIAHSNQGDFEAFAADPGTEALQDRIITIKVPYSLRVGDEVLIYRKLLPAVDTADVHTAPLVLPVAATFAVLSRLDPPNRSGMSLLDKLRLYDGWFLPKYSQQDVTAMRVGSPDEGMSGISPRYVMNKLSSLVSQRRHECVTPMAVLKELWSGVGEHIALASGDRARNAILLQDAVKQYELLALREVQGAFVEEFEQESGRLFDLYWANVRGYCQDDADSALDEQAMRQIEVALGVLEHAKKRFRQEVFRTISAAQAQGQDVDYTTEPRVRDAIERLLFPQRKELERSLVSATGREAAGEDGEPRAILHQRLIKKYGYCDTCARDLLEYLVFMLKGNQAVRVSRAHVVRWNWEVITTTS